MSMNLLAINLEGHVSVVLLLKHLPKTHSKCAGVADVEVDNICRL